MATNVDALREGLANYRETLEINNNRLSATFANLQVTWLSLRQEYEGSGAEEFGKAWAGSAQWFEQYFQQIRVMTAFLEERSENLKQL